MNEEVEEEGEAVFEEQSEEEEEKVPEVIAEDGKPYQVMKEGCAHYKRACKKRCEQCQEFFTCRFCHDDKKYLNEPDVKKAH